MVGTDGKTVEEYELEKLLLEIRVLRLQEECLGVLREILCDDSQGVDARLRAAEIVLRIIREGGEKDG